MRFLDFSSWQGVLVTLLGLAVVTLIGVGIRVLMMMTIQQRRERMNRQINERLRTLIAAYRILGGSFTGQLTVDPTHLRDLRVASPEDTGGMANVSPAAHAANPVNPANMPDPQNSDRSRRIRDAVEAALADIILLGTEEHVRLASKAASDMVAGRPIHTADLVVSLRNFIRIALDLDPIPEDVNILLQGPARTQGGSAGRGRGDAERTGNKSGGSGGGMDGSTGMGMGMGPGSGRSGGSND